MAAEPSFEPERVVRELNAAGVEYVVVGGLAVGAHGVVRATRDLDVVPNPDQANLARLAAVLTALGGLHPIEDSLAHENLARPVSFKVQTAAGEVHVLDRMPGTPSYFELSASRILVEVEAGVEAPVCSLAHLRQMKRASGRPRDQVDLAELAELHGGE